jgi:hypothetical protein
MQAAGGIILFSMADDTPKLSAFSLLNARRPANRLKDYPPEQQKAVLEVLAKASRLRRARVEAESVVAKRRANRTRKTRWRGKVSEPEAPYSEDISGNPLSIGGAATPRAGEAEQHGTAPPLVGQRRPEPRLYSRTSGKRFGEKPRIRELGGVFACGGLSEGQSIGRLSCGRHEP